MHRLIENGMLQKVIHKIIDGRDFNDHYNVGGSIIGYDCQLIYDRTLTGTTSDKKFVGDNNIRTDDDGYRRLAKDEELKITEINTAGNPDLYAEETVYANKLLNKINESYKNNEWESKHKADTVELVFFDHNNQGKQKLISGKVLTPIKFQKLDGDGKELAGAEFNIVNTNTGDIYKWTSTSGEDKLYLKEGSYYIEEVKAPSDNYELLKPFNIEVTSSEVNADDGYYPQLGNDVRIHVNDGYSTEVKLNGEVQKDSNETPLVKVEGQTVSVKNISDNLGKFAFTKRNDSVKPNGAEFTLTKIISSTNTQAVTNKDDGTFVYKNKSTGDYGEFEFKDMPVGYYLLEETQVPKGYKKTDNLILYAEEEYVNGNKKVVVKLVTDKGEEKAPTTIINKPLTTDISFKKVDNSQTSKALKGAKFRLISILTINNVVYFKEEVSAADGSFTFKDMPVGEYTLEELVAPEGYQRPKNLKDPFFGWKIFVKLNDKGKLEYTIYKLKTEADASKSETDLKDDKLPADQIIGQTVNIKNAIRTVDWEFNKYVENPNFDKNSPESKTNPRYVPIDAKLIKDDKPKFRLYESDYYGNIKKNQEPIIREITATTNNSGEYVFRLPDLKFNGYYRLEEVEAPNGYERADYIILKIEAETIANEGTMKVTVRDPNNNTLLGPHAFFEGVINYKTGSKLGKFAVKKTGMSMGPNKVEVGLRRAFFRLYTADDKFNILLNEAGYPAEYIQKVTPGNPITEVDENGKQVVDDNKDPIPVAPDTLPADQGIVEFDQLKPGKYVLEEYRGPAGYEKDTSHWYIWVKEDGSVVKSKDTNDEDFGRTPTAPNPSAGFPNNYSLNVKFFYNYFDYEKLGPDKRDSYGSIQLEEYRNGAWNPLLRQYTAPKNGTIGPFTGLSKDGIYRITYKLSAEAKQDFIDRKWGWASDTMHYPVDISKVDANGNVVVEISNGNLIRVFNKDEDGFRIPLRIAKVNADQSPLTGARFKAKKLVDGDPYKDDKGNTIYPKYYNEEFDGVTEATGLAGDNYFRELSPGIYELTEAEAPSEYKKLNNKWYFKVEVDPNKKPDDENYMRIVFDFYYQFPNDLSDDKYQHMTADEKLTIEVRPFLDFLQQQILENILQSQLKLIKIL